MFVHATCSFVFSIYFSTATLETHLWNDLDRTQRLAWGKKGCRVTHERRRHERNVGSRKPWTSRIQCTPGRTAPFLGRGVVLIKFQWLVAQLLPTSRLQTSKWKPDRHNMLASLANDIDLLQIGFKQRGSLGHFLLDLDSATKTFIFFASPVDYVVLLQTGFEQ